MPIYAYRCQDCGFEKDQLQKLSEAPLTVCPSCGGNGFARKLTAPAFQLKGSGWYVTDFRDGGQKKPGAEGAGDNAQGATGAASGTGADKAGEAGSNGGSAKADSAAGARDASSAAKPAAGAAAGAPAAAGATAKPSTASGPPSSSSGATA